MSLSAYEQQCRDVLMQAAAELGMVGAFSTGKTHNAFRVILTDNTVIKMAVYKTPRTKSGYLKTLPSTLKAHVHRALDKRGVS